MADQSHPFLEQIDHVGIQTDDPKGLVTFFTEKLGLPVAFSFVEYPFYTSGAIVLGNLFLEVMRFGPPRPRPDNPAAHYHIIGFLTRPRLLPNCLDGLSARDVAHSGRIPFYAPDATDAQPTVLWENIYLGEVLDTNRWMRLFFAMTQRSRPSPSAFKSPLMNRLSLALMGRAFRYGMPVITGYWHSYDDVKRAADAEALRACGGGVLGIQRVAEVVVGVPPNGRHADAWARLLAPTAVDAKRRFALGEGPALRLVERPTAGIQTMVIEVATISAVDAFALRHGLRLRSTGPLRTLVLPATQGLTLQFKEA